MDHRSSPTTIRRVSGVYGIGTVKSLRIQIYCDNPEIGWRIYAGECRCAAKDTGRCPEARITPVWFSTSHRVGLRTTGGYLHRGDGRIRLHQLSLDLYGPPGRAELRPGGKSNDVTTNQG